MNTIKPKFYQITIALLPNAEIIKEAERLNVKFEQLLTDIPNKKNIIHISLFQGYFCRMQLEKISEMLSQIVDSTFSLRIELDSKLTEACANLFWNVKPQAQLYELHKNILTAISPYREAPLPVFLDCYAQLPLIQQQLIDRYGTPHALHNFQPHITLYYNVGHRLKNDIKVIKPQRNFSFLVNQLIIGRIGYTGNLKEIYRKFQIKA